MIFWDGGTQLRFPPDILRVSAQYIRRFERTAKASKSWILMLGSKKTIAGGRFRNEKLKNPSRTNAKKGSTVMFVGLGVGSMWVSQPEKLRERGVLPELKPRTRQGGGSLRLLTVTFTLPQTGWNGFAVGTKGVPSPF